mmetsp:Transcript_18566/g.28658  ORF Transcript_18566/g.28658 Transcript_18566/m.28658 type:complete len:224 (+) Transcript_18566:596-1267(+)
MASSGSMLGSTPPYCAKVSPPPPPAPPAAAAPISPPMGAASPLKIGLVIRTSLGNTPAGMVTRWQFLSAPSSLALDPFAASTSSLNLGSLSPNSPIAMTSIKTLFFLSCFPALIKLRASAQVNGDPTNRTILCAPFLFRRCFNANVATCTLAAISTASFPLRTISPQKGTPWSALRIFPRSSVGLTNSSAPELGPDELMAMTPTVDSGLDCVFWLTIMLAASD